MISIVDLILSEYKTNLSTWATKNHQWGAKNIWGIIRYFNDKESASKFSQDRKTLPTKTAKQGPQRKEKKQGDDRADKD